MYKYRVDDSTTNKVMALASKNKDDEKLESLIKDLTNYNSVYENSSKLPASSVSFERMEDVEIDKDKIKQQAEAELSEYKSESIENINKNTEDKIAKLENDKETVEKNYKDATVETKAYYDDVKEDASNDVLRRGLSRSSIAINVMDAFDKSEIARYNELNDDLVNNINSIDTSISQLKLQQEEALGSFDVEYAVKLQERINKLTNDLIEKQNEVLKYNNEIAEKEAKYNKDYAEMEQELNKANWNKELDILEYVGKYGVNMIDKYKQTKIYDMAEKYLNTMDKSYALDVLANNKDLQNLLGEDNLAKLIKKYS